MERRILVERKVRAHAIVVGGVICQQMAEVSFPRSPNTTTWSRHSRRIEPISRSTWPFCQRDRSVANAHGLQPPGDRGAIRGVAVTDEVARCLIPWECF